MTKVLDLAAAHAARYLTTLPTHPVGATATIDELKRRLARPLPETGTDAETVIDKLVRDVDGGLMACTSGRFFGWVISGTLPAALAADWLTSTWDQNAASNLTAPAEAMIEEVCGAWLKDLLGIPSSASFAFVTGCQMAHTTALAAARHKLLRDRGWDLEASGLACAPKLKILTTESRHESICAPCVCSASAPTPSNTSPPTNVAACAWRASPRRCTARATAPRSSGCRRVISTPASSIRSAPPARSPMRQRPGSISTAPSACGRRPARDTVRC